jgi:hypothetical protein
MIRSKNETRREHFQNIMTLQDLPRLSFKEAAREGYVSLTWNIEVNSTEYWNKVNDMQGIDAVWIDLGDNQVQLARKRRELLTSDKVRNMNNCKKP